MKAFMPSTSQAGSGFVGADDHAERSGPRPKPKPRPRAIPIHLDGPSAGSSQLPGIGPNGSGQNNLPTVITLDDDDEDQFFMHKAGPTRRPFTKTKSKTISGEATNGSQANSSLTPALDMTTESGTPSVRSTSPRKRAHSESTTNGEDEAYLTADQGEPTPTMAPITISSDSPSPSEPSELADLGAQEPKSTFNEPSRAGPVSDLSKPTQDASTNRPSTTLATSSKTWKAPAFAELVEMDDSLDPNLGKGLSRLGIKSPEINSNCTAEEAYEKGIIVRLKVSTSLDDDLDRYQSWYPRSDVDRKSWEKKVLVYYRGDVHFELLYKFVHLKWKIPKDQVVLTYNRTRLWPTSNCRALGMIGDCKIAVNSKMAFQKRQKQRTDVPDLEDELVIRPMTKTNPNPNPGLGLKPPSPIKSTSGAVPAATNGSAQEATEALVKLMLKGQDGKDYKLRARKTTNCGMLVDAYKKAMKLEPELALAIMLDGERKDATETVEEMDLENGDQLDVVKI